MNNNISSVHFKTDSKTATFSLTGDWIIGCDNKERENAIKAFESKTFDKALLDANNVSNWDSYFISFLVKILKESKKNNIKLTMENLPKGVQPLLDLALSVAEKQTIEQKQIKLPFLERLGLFGLKQYETLLKVYSFCNQTCISIINLFKGKAVVRKVDILTELQDAGPNAFAIVSLICFLVGLILAFIGSIQLTMFGAQIYVASLVAIAITRVMGAIMAGVIVAGRTGASYAATLGSMQVNEEVDALKTMGISPFDFLVLPRFLSLSFMMPLLTIFADLMGILGGAFVGVLMLGLSLEEYFAMTLKALTMRNIIIGIIHGIAFGIIIALCGCYQGINCGRNASAVGVATTSAVVYSIVLMTLATAFLTFIFSI